MNAVQETGVKASEYLGIAYQLLVISEHVLVCSKDKKKICIFDSSLNLCFFINLSFEPLGITTLNGKCFITGIGTIGVIDIRIKDKKFKKATFEDVIGQKNIFLRGICASNQYLLVTEKDEKFPRLLLLEFINEKFELVDEMNDFPKHCSNEEKKFVPIVVKHCNGTNYYSQGCYEEDFHIVTVVATTNFKKPKKVFNV